jgi:hypothetical protein
MFLNNAFLPFPIVKCTVYEIGLRAPGTSELGMFTNTFRPTTFPPINSLPYEILSIFCCSELFWAFGLSSC